MQETAFDASAAAGYDLARYDELERVWLVRETDVECRRPLRYGDSIQVKTWVADFRRVRSRRMYEMRLAGTGELVARANTDWVYLDTVTGRPATIPPEMIAVFIPEGVAARGWPLERMVTEGTALTARRHQIEYLQPARLGDDLELATWACNVTDDSFTRHTTITRASDEMLLAQVHSTCGWLDLGTRRPAARPA